jgi:hypothetical protein
MANFSIHTRDTNIGEVSIRVPEFYANNIVANGVISLNNLDTIAEAVERASSVLAFYLNQEDEGQYEAVLSNSLTGKIIVEGVHQQVIVFYNEHEKKLEMEAILYEEQILTFMKQRYLSEVYYVSHSVCGFHYRYDGCCQW